LRSLENTITDTNILITLKHRLTQVHSREVVDVVADVLAELFLTAGRFKYTGC